MKLKLYGQDSVLLRNFSRGIYIDRIFLLRKERKMIIMKRNFIKLTGICLALVMVFSSIPVLVSAAGLEKTYTSTADFDFGSTNNTVTANDEVKLDDTTQAFKFMWVAVSSKGTVVKIETKTGEVLGEYKTAPDGQPTDPSRTTVDKNGSVWVANRAGNTVTRVCLPESGLWIDRNSNGVCDTSAGLDDIKAWTGADTSTADDECIINYVAVSSSGTRHVSVDGDNNVWVSGIANQIFDKIDGVTGAILRTEGPVGYGGYGGLIDMNNVVWSSGTTFGLLRWDTANPLSGPNGGNWNGYDNPSYGLAIDKFGNVWSSSYYADGLIRKYAPDGTLLGAYDQGYICARGCVADGNGDIWVAHSESGNAVGHLRNDGTYVGTVQVAAFPTGVAMDADGYIWVTSYNEGVVQRIDPALNGGVGAVDLTTVPLGGHLYNYSDMTGSTLVGAPNMGTWSVVYDSEKTDTKWGDIDWNSVVTDNGKLDVYVASSTDGITFGALTPATNGSDLSVDDGRYLEVVVNFTRATEGNKESPILFDISLREEIATSTISFDTVGGNVIDPVTGKVGDPVPEIANPVKEGFIFMGWDPAIPAAFPEEDMTVTAIWEAPYVMITLDGTDIGPTYSYLTPHAKYFKYVNLQLGYETNIENPARVEWTSSNFKVPITQDGLVTVSCAETLISDITINIYDADDNIIATDTVQLTFSKKPENLI